MKRIAVFCDGTWNELDARNATNIAKLYQMAEAMPVGPDGVEQVSYYIPGVGTVDEEQPRTTKLRDTLERFGGGAFGWGLDHKVLAAYRYLAKAYEPGDEVFVFGFSRGAYTARTLVGLVRNCGLPDDPSEETLKFAIGLYRSRNGYFSPNSYRMRRMRGWLSPKVSVSEWDRAGRANPNACPVIKISYLGIFDTVGALGVPGVLSALSSVFNRKYRFHDTELSSLVLSARHAVCIDDQRATYPPTLFDADKLEELNAGFDPEDHPYLESWFPGVHGMVGGGVLEGERGLSNASLAWVADGAIRAGFAFDPEQLNQHRADIDPLGPLTSAAKKEGAVDSLTKRLFPYNRTGRPYDFRVSDVATQRWLQTEGYRPPTLVKRAERSGFPVTTLAEKIGNPRPEERP